MAVATGTALLLAGSAAAGGAFLGGSTQKQSRKDVQVKRTYQPTINRQDQSTVNRTTNVSKTISPSSSRQITYNPQVQIRSPNAAIGSKLSQKSKKGGTSSSARAPVNQQPSLPVTTSPRSSGGQQTGNQGQTTGKGSKMLLLGGLAIAAFAVKEGAI